MAYRPKYVQQPSGKPEGGKGNIPALLPITGSLLLTAVLLAQLLLTPGSLKQNTRLDTDVAGRIRRHFDTRVEDLLLEFSGGESGKPAYRLEDRDLIAPVPDPACYGTAATAAELSWLPEAAAALLEGQDTLFTSQTQVKDSFGVRYYLDETILAITWKEAVDGSTYTFSEVKIAHHSQFRRFLSEGVYGSGVQRTTTEMSQSVNAVVASSGDYYDYREFGIVVNEGMVYRAKGELLDTCYIDDRGDLVFSYAGQLTDQETVERFVEENSVRFSLSFGPVMIEEEQVVVPPFYNSGEINKDYARAALCQLGPLHYVLVTANMEDPCYNVPTVKQFAENLHAMGIPRAYALDGGQTAAIAMDSQLINTVSYGCQREISDIIYFATALPE